MKKNSRGTTASTCGELVESAYTGIGVLNVFLLAAAVFLMMYFVVVSNIITSSNYKIGILNEELSDLIETNGFLTAQKLSVEDSSAVLDFVQNHNMVEAKYATHIFESGEVAALR